MYPISGVNNTFATYQFNPNFYSFYSFSSMKNVPHSNQTNNLQQMSYPKNIYTLPHINNKYKKAKEKKEDQKTEDSKENLHRKKFTAEEDEKLKLIVEQMGNRNWLQIAEHMPGRTGRQCRDRYQNYLLPGFFGGQWSNQEDELLISKYLEIGSRWSKMVQFFKNRNANSLKNRWNYYISKHLDEYLNRPKRIDKPIIPNQESIFKIETIKDNNMSSSSLSLIDFEQDNGNEEFNFKVEF